MKLGDICKVSNSGWNVIRPKPYTESGIKRVKCIRCGNPGHATWSICADLGLYRPLCKECDIALNRLVLEWAGHPDTEALMKKYEENK